MRTATVVTGVFAAILTGIAPGCTQTPKTPAVDVSSGDEALVGEDGIGDPNYSGQSLDGKKHGIGTYTAPDGSKYEGEWRNDLKHGTGTFTSPDGSTYEG